MGPRTKMFMITIWFNYSRCSWADYYIVHAETEEAAVRKFTLETGETPDRVDGPFKPHLVYFIGDTDEGVSRPTVLSEVRERKEDL